MGMLNRLLQIQAIQGILDFREEIFGNFQYIDDIFNWCFWKTELYGEGVYLKQRRVPRIEPWVIPTFEEQRDKKG